jgi:hypothetical protein
MGDMMAKGSPEAVAKVTQAFLVWRDTGDSEVGGQGFLHSPGTGSP